LTDRKHQMTLATDKLDQAREYHVSSTADQHATALAAVEIARSLREISLRLEQIQGTLHGLAQRP
jgi:hypothetical protein